MIFYGKMHIYSCDCLLKTSHWIKNYFVVMEQYHFL